MTQLIFAISLFCISTIFIMCLPSLFTNKYRFFPPASVGTWQYYLFWGLFRIFVICLIIVSVLEFVNTEGGMIYLMGLLLFVGGIGFACYISYVVLGQNNSYGGKSGLRTNGIYRWSGNPVYVVTFVGMLGWGLFIDSILVWWLLSVWAITYFLAPFIEESWLEKEYGKEYLEYKSKTPRFIGIPK